MKAKVFIKPFEGPQRSKSKNLTFRNARGRKSEGSSKEMFLCRVKIFQKLIA